MTTLYIVRHGNTFNSGDVVRRIGRRTDLPLSESGHAQAQALGEYFAENNITFEKIYAAPLKRTQETANAIAARASNSVDLITEPSLTEIDYGPDEDKPEEEVLARIGADALAVWNTQSIPPPGWEVDPEALIAAWRYLFDEIGKLPAGAAGLALTSNGVARFALDAASEAGADLPKKLRTGAFGRIEINDGKAVVKAWDVRP